MIVVHNDETAVCGVVVRRCNRSNVFREMIRQPLVLMQVRGEDEASSSGRSRRLACASQ